ncbi:GATA domain class transcription factor [Striga asiatica]|uniref:GATA domain class transcription factor n=1 Tax=Striga asiatica TaxID=4170 RepID=A0A5A7PWA3_STRAF|nr:GATA domain class transcription factor [Striga asiatica]
MNLNLNSTPLPFPMTQHQIITRDDNIVPTFGPNDPSSSSVSCRIFLNSTQDHRTGYYHDDHTELYRPQQISDGNHGGSIYENKNNRVYQSGLKLTLWKREDHEEHVDNRPVKWKSPKTRAMHKIKNNAGRLTLKITKNKLENQITSSFESDNSSSTGSYMTERSPIKVCSDCNTTKTPLWRSGPKGPKKSNEIFYFSYNVVFGQSLCNACGIRQRKARRSMVAAAAAAAANGTTVAASDHENPAKMKIKVKYKGKNAHFKKRCKIATSEVGSQSNGQKKIEFEDFLINLSKNLSYHRVFPEDEKDAAILLMALSSGLVHG